MPRSPALHDRLVSVSCGKTVVRENGAAAFSSVRSLALTQSQTVTLLLSLTLTITLIQNSLEIWVHPLHRGLPASGDLKSLM